MDLEHGGRAAEPSSAWKASCTLAAIVSVFILMHPGATRGKPPDDTGSDPAIVILGAAPEELQCVVNSWVGCLQYAPTQRILRLSNGQKQACAALRGCPEIVFPEGMVLPLEIVRELRECPEMEHARIHTILRSSQLDTLVRIEWQMALQAMPLARLLARIDVARTLQLSKDQRTRLRQLADQYEREDAEIHARLKKRQATGRDLHAHRTEFERRSWAVLSPQQVQYWRQRSSVSYKILLVHACR